MVDGTVSTPKPREGGHHTSGVQGLEGHMQGDAREAEGKAQPVQEADLVTQQVSCQQQCADFLWAEAGHGVRSWHDGMTHRAEVGTSLPGSPACRPPGVTEIQVHRGFP